MSADPRIAEIADALNRLDPERRAVLAAAIRAAAAEQQKEQEEK